MVRVLSVKTKRPSPHTQRCRGLVWLNYSYIPVPCENRAETYVGVFPYCKVCAASGGHPKGKIVPTSSQEDDSWCSMKVRPNTSRVVLVRDSEPDHMGRVYRLAYFAPADSSSERIGGKVAHWRWYENDLGFLERDSMTWKEIL